MKSLAYFIFLLSFCAPLARASTLTESFSSRDTLASSTAVWNQALGKIHPQLQAVNYKPSATPVAFSVGDGSHGAFEVSTYSQFSVGGDVSGNKIRFDTSRFPILQVTSFHLAQGWVLEPVGAAPLIIYSLSTVVIEGEIWCHGDAGQSAVNATFGAGGQGRCGGKNGGDGGAPGDDGQPGGDVNGSVTGGQGGNGTGGVAVGGGGGGSWNTTSPPGNGPNSSASGGTAGLSFSDPEFLNVLGGAGGGGGGGNADAGAGGGGGGGVVIIHAVGDVTIGAPPSSTYGFIFAQGGDGGDSNVTGGPGGGGGGGSVKVFSGGNINVDNDHVDGASRARQGADGTNAVPAGGGVGAPGRSWFASVGYTNAAGAYYTPSEEAPVVAANNTVEFTSQAQTVTTTSFDLLSTTATLDLVTLTPTSSDFQIEFRGSRDDFNSDDTGWSTNLASAAGKRFLQMRLTVTTSTPSNPTMLEQVILTYTPGQKKDFDFKSTGCGLVASMKPPQGPQGLSLLFLLGLPLSLCFSFRHRKHFAKCLSPTKG